MIPSNVDVYEVVEHVMTESSKVTDFGKQILTSGKQSGYGREVWISQLLEAAFKNAGYTVAREYTDRNRGRVDLAFFDKTNKPASIIEIKVYFSHHYHRKTNSHKILEIRPKTSRSVVTLEFRNMESFF